MKKILALLLCLVMICTMLPTWVLAEESSAVETEVTPTEEILDAEAAESTETEADTPIDPVGEADPAENHQDYVSGEEQAEVLMPEEPSAEPADTTTEPAGEGDSAATESPEAEQINQNREEAEAVEDEADIPAEPTENESLSDESFAEEEEEFELLADASSGTCGDNLTWTLDDAGTLTISGTGAMKDLSWGTLVDWKNAKVAIIENGVTTIADNSFTSCTDLERVTIPNTVTNIGYWAFNGCNKLTEVTIPGSVKNIEMRAFADCHGLTKVTIENGVESIEGGAFDGCDSLTSITIPESVTKIGEAFDQCSSLANIFVENGNQKYSSIDGVLFSKNGETLYTYPEGKTGAYVIPNGVKTIEDGAFEYCEKLTGSLTIPNSMTSIGADAFLDCTGLTEIIIQDGAEVYIGLRAFAGCENVAKIRIPESVTGFGFYVFLECNSLKTAGPIGGGYNYEFGWKTSIPKSAFQCAPIESVVIPETVTYIGDEAFLDCDNLTYVRINEGTKVGTDLFAFCDGLKTAGPIGGGYNIEFGWKDEIPYFLFGYSQLVELVIPNGMTKIESYNFYRTPLLQKVTIPSSVTELEYPLFGWGDEGLPEAVEFYYLGTEKQWSKVKNSDDLPDCVTVVFQPETLYAIDKTELNLVPGEKGKIALIDLNTDQEVSTTWKSSDTSCVTVDVKGNVTGIGLGTATISTTTPEGKTATCKVQVVFSDVSDPSAYYYIPVYWAASKGVTSGTSPSTFSPGKDCTRGQIVTFLWKAMGSPEPTSTDNPFTDVKPGDYFYKPVLWAKEKGVTSGTSATTFSPGKACTRGQIVTFLWKALGSPEPTDTSNPFTDVKTSDYFYKPVLWAKEKGVTSGTSATTFSPGKTCTRAQAMTFLYKATN